MASKTSIKILHVCTQDRGGAFQSAYNLHMGLLNEGIDSKMLVLRKTNTSLIQVHSFLKNRSFLYKFVDSINFRVHKWGKKICLNPKPKSKYSLPSSPYDILRHPLVQSSDILHLHWVSDFLNYSTFFKKTDKPIFWTLHDKNPFSGGFHFSSYEEASYGRLERSIIVKKTKTLSFARNLTIVSPSRWLYEESRSSKVLRNFEHHLIPYGLDTKLFETKNRINSRKLLKFPNNKKIILFVADSLEDERKGVRYLADALKFFSDDSLLLVIVGSGSFPNVENRIVSLGYIKDKVDLSLIYSAVDTFVIPSIEDNFPNTILESLACGTPVVGFNVGGIPDMVLHKFNGFLVDKISGKALADGIKHVLYNPSLYEKDKIRENLLNKFGLQNQAVNYIKLYENKLPNPVT